MAIALATGWTPDVVRAMKAGDLKALELEMKARARRQSR
jgi:hypothetical protein